MVSFLQIPSVRYLLEIVNLMKSNYNPVYISQKRIDEIEVSNMITMTITNLDLYIF